MASSPDFSGSATSTDETGESVTTRQVPLVLLWLILMVGLITSACGPPTEEAADEPSLATAAAPTSAVEVSDTTTTTSTTVAPTTTLDPAEQAWQNIIPFVVRGDGATRNRTTVMSVPFSFVPAQGWVKWDERSTSLAANEGDPLTFLVFSAVSMSVDELVVAYEAVSECFDAAMTEPLPSEVGGASGVTFEIVGLPEFTDDACEVPNMDVNEDFVAGVGRGLFHIVDVSGTTVAAIYWTFPGQYADHLNSVNDMLESVIWKTLD